VPRFPLLRSRLRLAATHVPLLCLLAACDGSRDTAPAAIEVAGDDGAVVRLEVPAQRIVSLVPARTDLIVALGAADRIVARTQFDEDPRLAGVPSVGNALTPSVEWLMAQRPDLVVAWPDQQQRTVVTRLRELGVPVYASGVENLAEVDRSIAQLGTLLGLNAAADSLRGAIRAQLDSAAGIALTGRSPTVVYLIGLDPAVAAGPGTYIDEILGIAGARNVFDEDGGLGLWPTVSLEEIVRRQPEHVLLAVGEASAPHAIRQLSTRAGWRDVAAVRDGRVHALDPDLFNRPGARVGEAALRIARLLHGQDEDR
jgi:ABC-type Fe3+-hydroxamate transport system substrate-binding protein